MRHTCPSPDAFDRTVKKAVRPSGAWGYMGIVTIPGMVEKGDMAASPKLEEARALGTSLRG